MLFHNHGNKSSDVRPRSLILSIIFFFIENLAYTIFMLSKTRNVIQIMIVIALKHYIRLIYRKDCFRMMKYNRFRNETLINNPYRYQETKTIDMLNFIYLCFKMLLDQKNYIYSKD